MDSWSFLYFLHLTSVSGRSCLSLASCLWSSPFPGLGFFLGIDVIPFHCRSISAGPCTRHFLPGDFPICGSFISGLMFASFCRSSFYLLLYWIHFGIKFLPLWILVHSSVLPFHPRSLVRFFFTSFLSPFSMRSSTGIPFWGSPL